MNTTLTPPEYVSQWMQEAKKLADPSKAAPMQSYLRDQFELLGIQAKPRQDMQREFLQQHGIPTVEALPEVTNLLWENPYREAQYFGMQLPMKLKKQWHPQLLDTFEAMVVNKSWWDTVDFVAGTLIGEFFKKFPDEKEEVCLHWSQSPNFWLNRTAILFQLKYKDKTDWELLQQAILPHIHSKEFFLQKAIGWALRQYARTAPEQVIAFVDTHPLKPLSRREAMKHLANKGQ